MPSAPALVRASSSFASHKAIISTKPTRRAASTCAGPINPVPMIPALMVFIIPCVPDVGGLFEARHFDPIPRLDGFHYGFEHGHTFCAVFKIRMHLAVGGDGIDKVGHGVNECVFVTDHMSRRPPRAKIRVTALGDHDGFETRLV